MHSILHRKNVAKARLAKLISPRNRVLPEEPAEILYNAPTISIKPITRLLIVSIALIAGLWWLTRPAELSKVENLTEASRSQSESQTMGQIIVHVTGDVVSPGIVKLSAGSRVIDAITAAGGFAQGATEGSLNLAALVEDGQLISVGASVAAEADSRIDLNTATLEQLETLPGVGPVMATRILEWRKTHNRFSSVDELQEVDGIGPKLFNRIKDAVRI